MPALPPHRAYVFVSLFASGLLAAGMVFYFDRPLIMITLFVSFFGLSFLLSAWHDSLHRPPGTEFSTNLTAAETTAVQEYRRRMQPAITRDIMITIAMMALGWTFFARAMQKEVQRRVAMESELKVARKIQESLLPAPERNINGWHLHGLVQPASEVAGDYFDYIELPNNRLGVLVADASGHGVSAGLMMAMIKSQLLNATVDDPQQLLAQLNRSVRRLAPKNMFVTAVYVILHPQQEVEIITAGHPPVLHYHAASRSIEMIGTAGMALGFTANLSTPSVKCKLAEGDTLLLYTDGIYEQFNAKNTEWGLQNLQATLLRHAHLPPPALCPGILAEAAAHRGTQPQADDITLVAIRRQAL